MSLKLLLLIYMCHIGFLRASAQAECLNVSCFPYHSSLVHRQHVAYVACGLCDPHASLSSVTHACCDRRSPGLTDVNAVIWPAHDRGFGVSAGHQQQRAAQCVVHAVPGADGGGGVHTRQHH